MNPAFRTQLLLAAPGLGLAAAMAAAVLAGHQPDRLVNAVQGALGLILVWSVGAAIHLRYPDRPLGRLLFLLAVLYASLALQASDQPVLFTLARATRPAMEVLLVWIMLAFPSGRLTGRLERGLVIVAALAVVLLWLPSAMLTAQIPLAGPLVLCHADCPRNVLFVVERPELSQSFNLAFRVVGTLVMLATTAKLFDRLRGATPSMRRDPGP